MLRKHDQKRKRPNGSRVVDTEEDFNYEVNGSELSSGDLSSSDFDLSSDYGSYMPRKKSRRKPRERSQSAAPSSNNSKGHVSDTDETGEEKINKYGRLLGDREYKVPVFTLPTRGETLFMFSKDPAALLGYRDSFAFLKRNTNLIKVHLNNAEKGHLVDSGQLRPSFRTREMSVVTARSVFKRFGYRVIRKGRRGKDDYFFTEPEPVVEKMQAVEANKPNGNGINDELITATVTNVSANNSIPTAAATSTALNNSTQIMSATMMGKNGLQYESANRYEDDLNWMHCAAVTARQFNSSLFSYRRLNPTNYDLLTNVYQITKNKQVFNESNESNPIIKRELESNTHGKSFIY